MSPETLNTWQVFLKAHAMMTRVLERELLASHRLPLAEYDVLVQLSAAPEGRLRMAQLADRVLLSRSGLTRLVERLENTGLVRREVCPSDARGSFAVLTGAGQAHLAAAAVEHLASVKAHFGDALDCQQMANLGTALQRLVDANKAEASESCLSCTDAPMSSKEGE